MVKHLPASARDMGSIPGPGGSHKPQGSQAHVPQLLSLCSRAQDLQLLSPESLELVLCKSRSHRNEKPACHN